MKRSSNNLYNPNDTQKCKFSYIAIHLPVFLSYDLSNAVVSFLLLLLFDCPLHLVVPSLAQSDPFPQLRRSTLFAAAREDGGRARVTDNCDVVVVRMASGLRVGHISVGDQVAGGGVADNRHGKTGERHRVDKVTFVGGAALTTGCVG